MEISLSSSFVAYGTTFPHNKRSSIKAKCEFYDKVFKCPKNSTLKANFYGMRGYSRRISTGYRNQFLIMAQASSEDGSVEALNRVATFTNATWKFLRPYAILGTIIGSTSLLTRALLENPNLLRWSLLLKAFSGLVALICGNAYVVGINQIYDVEIDKINKPSLPLAAGDLSIQSAWVLVLLFATIGISIVAMDCGPFLTFIYCLVLFLGTAYSAPPFRWKRFPFGAMFFMIMGRGLLLNFGVYHAVRGALGLTFQWSIPMTFITTFVTSLAIVMSITKDLPDLEGDQKYQISTLATKFGAQNIALVGSGIMLINYIGSIIVAFYMPHAFKSNVMIPLHAILASRLIFQTWALDRANYSKEAGTSYYILLWNLLCVEYMIFPFI